MFLTSLVDMNHDLLASLGVSHPALTNHQACKLTGAGGGGCA